LLKLIVPEEPGDSVPVSKLLPSSETAVCAVLSSLVTVTRAPPWTVMVAGVNLKSAIFTALAVAPDPDPEDAELALADASFPSSPPPQAASSVAEAAIARTEPMR
jgi:hypothetical protein